jgi:demethylmenaquinone methyltransferase/2-methoxy-6-polyprenyl-1,4-benzoquinol methylase
MLADRARTLTALDGAPEMLALAAQRAAGGQVVFIDDAQRCGEELAYGPGSPVVRRTLPDGSRHRVVKMPHRPETLQVRLAALGWEVEMRDAAPCFWGVGRRG